MSTRLLCAMVLVLAVSLFASAGRAGDATAPDSDRPAAGPAVTRAPDGGGERLLWLTWEEWEPLWGFILCPASYDAFAADTNVQCYLAWEDADYWTGGLDEEEGPWYTPLCGTATFQWSASGGSFDNPTAELPTWRTPAQPGVYTVSVTITDVPENAAWGAPAYDDGYVVVTWEDVCIVAADVDAEGVTEEEEQDPGLFLAVNDDDDDENSTPDCDDDMTDERFEADAHDLRRLWLTIVPGEALESGTLKLYFDDGCLNIYSWKEVDEQSVWTKHTSSPLTYDPAADYYCEGKAAGGGAGTELRLKYEHANFGVVAEDAIKVTVLHWVKVPLGGSAYLSKYAMGKAYVPTRWGGTFSTDSGVSIYYLDGSNPTLGTAIDIYTGELPAEATTEYSVPRGEYQWIYIRPAGSESPVQVGASFSQSAQATTRPWNFYWWATKGDHIIEPEENGNDTADTAADANDVQVIAKEDPAAPGEDIVRCGTDGILQTTPDGDDELVAMTNLFDTPGPLTKFDAIYSTSARDWEAANHYGLERWEGHCLGGAMASILVLQPIPSGASGLSQDDLEGLWSELADNATYTYGTTMYGCPAGPPTSGTDTTDGYAAPFHAMLEKFIGEDGVALQTDLRCAPSQDADPDQVWNHALWKYEASYTEAAGGDHTRVTITVSAYANDDHRPPTDDTDDRAVTYTYILTYGASGSVDTGAQDNDWVSVGGSAAYAPYNLLRITGVTWGAANPHVTEARVRALDDAN